MTARRFSANINWRQINNRCCQKHTTLSSHYNIDNIKRYLWLKCQSNILIRLYFNYKYLYFRLGLHINICVCMCERERSIIGAWRKCPMTKKKRLSWKQMDFCPIPIMKTSFPDPYGFPVSLQVSSVYLTTEWNKTVSFVCITLLRYTMNTVPLNRALMWNRAFPVYVQSRWVNSFLKRPVSHETNPHKRLMSGPLVAEATPMKGKWTTCRLNRTRHRHTPHTTSSLPRLTVTEGAAWARALIIQRRSR